MFSSSVNPENKEIFTVAQLNQAARTLLEQNFTKIWVKGELSGVKLYPSGHLYFTLKDQHALINCVMFSGKYRQLGFTPINGMAVLLRADVSIYEQQGKYQLNVTHMEEGGLGLLQQAFEALKAKLQSLDFFDQSHKKPLPRFPNHIGVVTSGTGAAIQDILSVLKRRFPIAQVTIYHTAVQGKGAAAEIAKAINFANSHNQAKVLIVARGGGSLEDLWCFNEEIVACAIYQSTIPIVTGVGHEIDFTIADFVADCRAPTPSVAAETVTPDCLDLIRVFEQHQLHLEQTIKRKLQHFAQKLDSLGKQLIHPGQRLQQTRIMCQHLVQRLLSSMNKKIQQSQYTLSLCSNALNNISPLATLGRGYAIVMTTDSGEIIQDVNKLSASQQVKTRLANGYFVSSIDSITPIIPC